jgi:23S rRNA (uracil1939-C5)-methyltransferase
VTTPADCDRSVDCPHADDCGACALLRTGYGRQLDLKRRWLGEALERELRLDRRRVLPTLPSPLVEGYRNRVKMTISTGRDRGARLGYFRRGTREVVDTPSCGVLVPELLETTRQLRRFLNSRHDLPFALRHVDLRCGSEPRSQLLTLVVKGRELGRFPVEALAEACPQVAGIGVNLNPAATAQVLKGPVRPLAGVREVFVETAGLAMRVSAGSFFQVNLSLLPRIHALMGEFLGRGALLLDLYAGVGTHGLALRDRFRRVLCVEGVRSATADAKATIEAGRVRNVEVLAQPLRRALHRLRAEGRVRNVEVLAQPLRRALHRLRAEPADAVVLNPSREGAERAALEVLLTSPARRIAYLSCSPPTLARDLALLTRGGFRLESVQAVDMMPQTRQVEALALLER